MSKRGKRKITCLLLGDQYRYTVERKEHWYSKWHFIYDGQYPRLFKLTELVLLHIISIEEMERYFSGNNIDSTVVLP